MRTNFASYKAILTQAVSYQPFVNANAIFTDVSVKQDVLDRIAAQGPDVVVAQGFADVMTTGGIVGTKFSVDALNRRIDIATGSLGIEERAIFNAFTPAPLQIYSWLLAWDSTALQTDVQVHFRGASPDPWHVLNQVDSLSVPVGPFQLSLFLPLAVLSAKYVTQLYVLARQI